MKRPTSVLLHCALPLCAVLCLLVPAALALPVAAALHRALPTNGGVVRCVLCFVPLAVLRAACASRATVSICPDQPTHPSVARGGLSCNGGGSPYPLPAGQLRCCQTHPAIPGLPMGGGGSFVGGGRGGLVVTRAPRLGPARAPAGLAVAALM